MKKTIIAVLMLILICSLSGCSGKTLTNHANLGYDLSNAGYEGAVFNVYHSNTDNHKWELLKTFSCRPEKGQFTDIRVESTENQIIITSEYNRVEKTEDTEAYYTEDIDEYRFTVDGFSGWIGQFQTFEIKDTEEEQLYRIYPISNDDGGVIYQSLKLDKPYDKEEENLDNILITIKLI